MLNSGTGHYRQSERQRRLRKNNYKYVILHRAPAETKGRIQRLRALRATPLVCGHFRRGTNVKPEVDAWIAGQRLNRLAQAAVAEATAAWAILLDRSAVARKRPNSSGRCKQRLPTGLTPG
jgi:hypothetical protein